MYAKNQNHSQIKIFMSKDVDLSNMLFLAIHFVPYFMYEQKVFKIYGLWFLVTWNNVDQLQWNRSCIQML